MSKALSVPGNQAASIVRVLLINNDEHMSRFIGSLLSKSKHNDYRKFHAKSLNQAVGAINGNTCEVVLANYYWGKTRIGDKFLKWVKVKKPHLPVIVITRDFDKTVDSTAIKLGAADYVTASDLTHKQLDRAIRYAIERKDNVNHLNYLIHHDYLTSLPNRVLFTQRLKHAVNIAERESDTFALMLIKLNNFHEVNELYGYDTGDTLLKIFAEGLNCITGKKGSPARLGDCEFAIIIKNYGTLERIQLLAEKIIEFGSKRIQVGSHYIMLNCSVGVSIYPKSATHPEKLQRNASMAMAKASREKVSSYQFYSSDTEQQHYSYSQQQEEFIKALASNQIGLYFNPRIDTATGNIIGIEVNPYWSHPEKGLLEYEQFVWHGLDNNVAGRFTEWLLATSFEYFNKLNIADGTKLIFNIEFQGLSSANFPNIVEQHLEKYQISGSRLEFDLSRVVTSEHTNILESCMHRLQTQGVTFGVNHFGTDEMSLGYVKSLPVSVLKLDKSFVTDMNDDVKDTLMIKALVDFAHSLSKQVAVEGLHSELPIEMIKDLGFDYYKSVFSVDALSLVKLQDVIEHPLSTNQDNPVKLVDPKN